MKQMGRLKTGTFAASALLCTMLLSQGCVFLIPIVTAYYDDGSITVTAEIPKNASVVFEAMKKRAEMKGTDSGVSFDVTNVDEKKYAITVVGTDKTWNAIFSVIPISTNVSQVIARGTDDVRTKDDSEQLVLAGIKRLCDDLGVKYTVVGEKKDKE